MGSVMEQIVLAHTSDVHFGPRAFPDQAFELPGQHGHDPALCFALPEVLEFLRLQQQQGQAHDAENHGDLQ